MASSNTVSDPVKLLAQRLLDVGYENLPERERKILERVAKRVSISRDIATEFDQQLTFAEKLADRIASFGGSWTFILIFAFAILLWVALNGVVLTYWHGAFDPYPFILLNLFLSLVAAMQAPVIMMSQNRQAEKDRMHAAHDYEVNLKAEIEIMALHEKLDEMRVKDIANLLKQVAAAAERR